MKAKARTTWLTTLTRVQYTPTGLDTVIHNYGLPNAVSEKINFVGPDRFIDDKKDRKVCKALLGTDDVAEINRVYQWLNGTNACLWRKNRKPQHQVDRVARFVAYSVGADLGCDGDPDSRNSSLGVRFASDDAKNLGVKNGNR